MRQDAGNERVERLSVRVSHEEFEMIRDNAALYGLPVATFIRAAGIGELPKKKKSECGINRPVKSTVELLRNFSLFAGLDEEELLKTLHCITVEKFKKNDIILVEGDSNRFMYYILTGRVKVLQVSEEGKELILAMHSAGDFFGEMSLIDGSTACATVAAADHCTIALISKANFFSLIYTQKKILRNVLQTFCRRIRASNRTVAMMTQMSAAHRVRMLLLMLSEKHGKMLDDTVVLSILVTHQDIADMTSLTRQTVTKIMNELKEEGVITVQENKQIRLNKSFFIVGAG